MDFQIQLPERKKKSAVQTLQPHGFLRVGQTGISLPLWEVALAYGSSLQHKGKDLWDALLSTVPEMMLLWEHGTSSPHYVCSILQAAGPLLSSWWTMAWI